jgi:hypothetical protein
LISDAALVSGTYTAKLYATNLFGTGSASLDIDIAPSGTTGPGGPVPVITSATLVTGSVGSAFSYQIVAANNPSSYDASGLPGGLSINTVSGLISGTPALSGTYDATLLATNVYSTGSASVNFIIAGSGTIPPGAAPVITSTLYVTASTTGAFNYQIIATNGPDSYSASGLPAGLLINGASGLISGTPVVSGTYAALLHASNTHGAGTATLSLKIIGIGTEPSNAAPVIVSATSVIVGRVDSPLFYQVVATNNPASYNATGLPGGLDINHLSGLVTGARINRAPSPQTSWRQTPSEPIRRHSTLLSNPRAQAAAARFP